VLADSYLSEPDLATAEARSAQQCAVMSCQPPTLYWWSVLTLPCGTLGAYWLDMEPAGVYGPSGLTAQDPAPQPYDALNADGCFPPPVSSGGP
jgi:hypothetical protein